MIYHYTPVTQIPLIDRDGFIKVSTEDFPDPRHRAVWFSTNTTFEKTAATLARRIDGGTEELPPTRFGYFRIGVDDPVAPLPFEDFCRVAAIPAGMRHRLLDRAAAVGADPNEWFATFEAVRREKWACVEALWNHRWIDIRVGGREMSELIARCMQAWMAGQNVQIVSPPG